ncbi:hypothetical protein CFC21_028771 [Triticum aestivum]|uniref:Pentacotripeptide-repeat region of PRORP domain-containing protein n=2 Tax=Triticum aestivum TaxID=4565 RepID=A0A3B6DCR2_WHEAT|nr:hypothetical protein CFC21_028771 [Triticum aestivum]
MHRAVLSFMRQALVKRSCPPALRLYSVACCLKSLDHQEPAGSFFFSEYKNPCLPPLITLAVRTSNWNKARKITFRECVNNLGGSMTLLQVHATAIRVFVELSMFEDALLTYIEAKKVGVELQLCNFLLKLCLEEAFELLCEMEMKGVKPNAVTYGTYLYGLCRTRHVSSAWNFLQMLCQRGYPRNSYCYNAVIHGFCHEDQVHKAMEVFDGMKKGGHSYLKEALGVFELMFEKGISPNIVTCTILVDSFSKEGMINEALLFLDKVRHLGIVPNLCMYRVIINGLCKVNKCDDVCIIIDGCVKALKLQEAFRLFHKMLDEGTKPNIFTYTSLINGLCHNDRLSEAVTLFKHMIWEGLTPDRILYTSLIACYCKRSNMKAALEIFREMEKGGLSADAFVYTCLIGGFSKVLAMDGAQWLMEEMINKGLTPTVVTYTDIIVGYFKTGDEKKAHMMYNSMLQAGITPDDKLSSMLGFGNDGDSFQDSLEEKDIS